MPAFSLPDAVLAVGSLGTASFALVDATKAFGGGISNRGFTGISRMLGRFLPSAGTEFRSVRNTLRANWINGTASLGDQKSIAKTLIKLHLTDANAAHMAHQTAVDSTLLTQVARKYAAPTATLTPEEQNVASRFDLQLASIIDDAYQRGDQNYRNSAKVLAIVFAVILAVSSKYALGMKEIDLTVAIIAGLLAAPLAPISKDLASALQAGAKALQSLKN